MRIARVFARRTNATPIDELAFYDVPGFPAMLPEIDKVHVSVTFSWDIPRAEMLAHEWESIANVSIGGPAMGDRGGNFTPGLYLKDGYVITSRGCPNQCWFCSVPKREGPLRELPITDGYNVLDDNLLACSEGHIRSVFSMLAQQKNRAQFTGGLEAARLDPWHVEEFCQLRIESMFFAYDTPDDYDPLLQAGKMLREAGLSIQADGEVSTHYRCYVLCGFKNDTLDKAEQRMINTYKAGFYPCAMLYRDHTGIRPLDWIPFARTYTRTAATKARLRELGVKEAAC